MGGCKCTYRSCAKSSDGKTHFFHYPIKDVKRRNQWLVNSNRLEFLKLTLPQLRNKVVCERHFSENMFMNYKHDRLVHDAVPNKEQWDGQSNDIKDKPIVVFNSPHSITDNLKCYEKKEQDKTTTVCKTVFPKPNINTVQKSIPNGTSVPSQQFKNENQPQTEILGVTDNTGIGFEIPIQRTDVNVSRNIEKEIVNQNINLTNEGTDNLNNKHIIIFPREKEISDKTALPSQPQIENQTKTLDNIEYVKLVEDGSKVMSELKFLLDKHRHAPLKRLMMKEPVKKKVNSEWKPLSKASLYAQIVPYLSPELAKMVHKEMFPSMRHMHRM